MSRVLAREFGFKIIYENLFNEDADIDLILEESNLTDDEVVFVKNIFDAYKNHKQDIEDDISKNLVGYQYSRIYKIDLALLIEAVCEIKYLKEPVPIVVNEIVELSKKFSTDKSPAFINGVLSKFVKDIK